MLIASTAGVAAIGLVAAVFIYFAQSGDATKRRPAPPEVFETVSQRDFGWGYAGWLWLERVPQGDEFLSEAEAIERYEYHSPDVPLTPGTAAAYPPGFRHGGRW
jgi:hypothetical protein